MHTILVTGITYFDQTMVVSLNITKLFCRRNDNATDASFSIRNGTHELTFSYNHSRDSDYVTLDTKLRSSFIGGSFDIDLMEVISAVVENVDNIEACAASIANGSRVVHYEDNTSGGRSGLVDYESSLPVAVDQTKYNLALQMLRSVQ